jgi:hypothetical protein
MSFTRTATSTVESVRTRLGKAVVLVPIVAFLFVALLAGCGGGGGGY